MKTGKELQEMRREVVRNLSVPEDNAVWQGVKLAGEIFAKVLQEEHNRPDLANESRQYNAGQMAGLVNFENFLQELFDEAHVKPEPKQ